MKEGYGCAVMGLRAEDGVQRYWCWSFEAINTVAVSVENAPGKANRYRVTEAREERWWEALERRETEGGRPYLNRGSWGRVSAAVVLEWSLRALPGRDTLIRALR